MCDPGMTSCVCLSVWGTGGGGMDGGWTPLPTHPQRYCDPVSLVEMQSEAQFIKRIRASKLYRVFAIFKEICANFGRLLRLSKLSYIPQLGHILMSSVFSLKWAQVELICSIRLGDTSSQSCGFLCHCSENNIDFGSRLLLNELNKWPQFGLILKSCVCSLKWV